MQTETFMGWNNQSFVLTLDMTKWLAVFPSLAQGTFRAALVDAAAAPKPGRQTALAFSSAAADGAAGTLAYNPSAIYVVDATTNPPTTKTAPTLTWTAPVSAVSSLLGTYNYDCHVVLGGLAYGILGGQIVMLAGYATDPPAPASS